MQDSTRQYPVAQEVQQLESWKEIAHHFGVTVRTVQLWEVERGLPIHRKAGPKGRVFAFIDELENWADGRTPEPTAGHIELDNSDSASRMDESKPWWQHGSTSFRVAAALALLLALGASAYFAISPSPGVVDVRASKWEVCGFDAAGTTVWTHRWQQAYFEAFAHEDDPLRPLVVDLNGDGRNESLVWHQVEKNRGLPENNATLYCFSEDGAIHWTFQAEGSLRTAAGEYTPPYAARHLRLVRYDKGTKLGVLIVVNHHSYFPSRVILLSSEGIPLREYDHSGHLHSALVDDFNGDGREEIYLMGIANGYGEVDVVVLDPDAMEGTSSESRHQLLNRPVGVEMARIVLSRGALSKLVEPYAGVGQIVRNGEQLVFSTREGTALLPNVVSSYFHFNRNLELISAGISDNYINQWRNQQDLGKIGRDFSPSDLDELRKIIYLQPPVWANQADPHSAGLR